MNMLLKVVILLFIVIRLSFQQGEEHHCVWYDQCYFDGVFWKNCAYNGSALPLFADGNDELVESILRMRCPHLLQDENGNPIPLEELRTCCSKSQLIDMDSSFSLSDSVLGRCPSCRNNFERHICDYNCLADQSRFLVGYTNFSDTGVEYINELDFYVHNDYMDNSFDSCADVIVSQTGLPAVNLMCGSAPVCDADAWFASGGDVSSPFVPIQVNFIRSNDESISLNPPTLGCNETSENTIACSCVDCFESCPVGNEPVLSTASCTVLSFNCLSFSIGLGVFIIGVTVFSILTIVDYYKTRTSRVKIDDEAGNALVISKLITFMQNIFSKIGVYSSSYPAVMFMLTSWLVIILVYGAFQLNVTANPIEIWSSPESQSRKELEYFNTRFGPFYRTTQVFLKVVGRPPFQIESATGNITYGPAFTFEAIQELIQLEDRILNLGRNIDIPLEKVCYAPLRPRGGDEDITQCVVMSPATFFGANRYLINENNYLGLMQGCINNYLSLECLASWGGGAEPDLVLGGWNDTVLEADSLVITLPIANHLLQSDLEPALEWEQLFLDAITEYEENELPDYLEIAYAAERSIEDEIIRTSQAELIPISISYILMFVYVAFALGKIKSWKTLLIHSKIAVAVASIIIVILAIISALGVLGFSGIPITLIAINVIPFFILSVGIDNIFLMVNSIDQISASLKQNKRYDESFSYAQKKKLIFSEMMREVGPSIFVTSASQVVCFGIGVISAAPAVQTFAVFAAISLAFLFIFQMTTSIAVLSLDYDRCAQNRIDIFICLKSKSSGEKIGPYKSVTQRLIEIFASFLFKWQVKILVMIIFFAVFGVSIMFIPSLDVGLDQEMSVPVDSYVYRYLNAVNQILKLGPPVYFVLTAGLNFTEPVHQNAVCGGQLCNSDSLTTQVFLASLYDDITYIAKPSNSWLDDYFDWSGLRGSCCQYNVANESFCESTDTSGQCAYCVIGMDEYNIRPLASEFIKYLPFFLQDPPTDQCNKGGLASYSLGVNYILDNDGLASVQDSHFMAYHTPLSTSSDYYESLRYAREISKNITDAIRNSTGVENVTVFPYSIAYVYYEQYLTVHMDTVLALTYSMTGVLLVLLLMSGFSLFNAFVMLVTVIMILIDMMGLMYIWNIPLNAVSLVNLIISIGIGVEFCSHTLYAYGVSNKPVREKSKDALIKMGAVIINGITFTNIPIVVLAFSVTELIETFFFRMFFGLVIIGFCHGIIFLPVFLSFLSNLSSYR